MFLIKYFSFYLFNKLIFLHIWLSFYYYFLFVYIILGIHWYIIKLNKSVKHLNNFFKIINFYSLINSFSLLFFLINIIYFWNC